MSNRNRGHSVSVVVLACVVLASSGGAQVEIVPRDTIRPIQPRDTRPWVPRDSLVAETTAVVTHVVKPGDTLWDLARRYLNDPYRWPDVFRANSGTVENPHWIYPGELLRMPASAVRSEALREAELEGRVAEGEGVVVSRVVTRPAQALETEPTVFANRIIPRASGVGRVAVREQVTRVRQGEVDAAPLLIGRHGPRGAGRIVGTAERAAVGSDAIGLRFQLNDDAYISAPTGAAMTIGSRYLVLSRGPELSDTLQVFVPTGIVRLIAPGARGQPAKARLIRQFGEVFVDQLLVPYTAEVGPQRGIVPVIAGGAATVIWVQNDPVLPSLQHYILLSLPRGQQAQIGDRFTLVDQTTLGARDPRAPPEDAAVVEVVRVTRFAATAIVIAHRLPTIVEGMRARLTGRLE